MQQSVKDGTRLAKRSFIVLGIVYVIFAITKLKLVVGGLFSLFLYPVMLVLMGTLAVELHPFVQYAIPLAGIVLIVAGYLIAKRNIIGVYLGWLFVLVGVIVLFSENISLNILPFIILTYLSYINYKAHKTLILERKGISSVQ